MNALKHQVAWDYNELLTLNKQFGKYKQWFAVATYSSTFRQQVQQADDSQGALLLHKAHGTAKPFSINANLPQQFLDGFLIRKLTKWAIKMKLSRRLCQVFLMRHF